MAEEKVPLDKLYVSDDKLQSLWKYAVTLSLGPDNIFPAYKLYYILLKKEIAEKHLRNKPQKPINGEVKNDKENLHDREKGSDTQSSVGME